MKKLFELPELEVEKFQVEEIITTSLTGDVDGLNPDTDIGDWGI